MIGFCASFDATSPGNFAGAFLGVFPLVSCAILFCRFVLALGSLIPAQPLSTLFFGMVAATLGACCGFLVGVIFGAATESVLPSRCERLPPFIFVGSS